MAGQREMTPERAGQLGGRWRLANLGALVVSFGCMVAGLELGFIVALLVALYCGSESADHYGWRRGYLARKDEEPQRSAPRLHVLRLPIEEVDGEMREPFAFVLDGVRAVSDKAFANVEAAMKEFAHECGGRGAMVSSVPVDVVEPHVTVPPVTNVIIPEDGKLDGTAIEELRQHVMDAAKRQGGAR